MLEFVRIDVEAVTRAKRIRPTSIEPVPRRVYEDPICARVFDIEDAGRVADGGMPRGHLRVRQDPIAVAVAADDAACCGEDLTAPLAQLRSLRADHLEGKNHRVSRSSIRV